MKFDFHIHTARSPEGVHSLKQMIKRAKKIGLQAITITDHYKLLTIQTAKKLTKQYRIMIISGVEIGKMGFGKHLLALNIPRHPPSDNIHHILEFIENEGGLSIAPHPFSKNGFLR